MAFIVINLGLTFICQSTKAKEEYSIGFSNKTNYTLIYEYSIVDESKLEYLYQQTGVESYDDLAEFSEGEQFKMVITSIEEESDSWTIITALYSGENLDRRSEDVENKAFKDPDDLGDNLLEEESESDILTLVFLPIQTDEYLEEFATSVINDDKYLEKEYELYLEDYKLTFDYTGYGYSDAIVQEYNEEGILDSLTVLCDGKEAFKQELKDSYEDNKVVLFIVLMVIICVIPIAASVGYIYYRKKDKKIQYSENKVDKLIRKIK